MDLALRHPRHCLIIGDTKTDIDRERLHRGDFPAAFPLCLLLAIGVDTAIEQATAWLQETWRDRDLLLVLLQLVIGVVMVLFGYPPFLH